jgi:hypothetical protein
VFLNNILYLLEKQLNSCIKKKYIAIATLLLSGMIFAQNNKPKEAVGDLVKATSFHDNGKYNKWVLQKWETTRRMGFFDSNGNKQPWQHMIMKSENGFGTILF